MFNLRRPTAIALVLLTCCGSLVLGQADDPTPDTTAASGSTAKTRPTSGSDRFYLAFVEDATVVDRQWWEGQLSYADFDRGKTIALVGVVAFQPWVDWEIGGSVGFGDTSIDGTGLDGSGATDLDIYAKYHLGGGGDNEFGVGGVITVPTGDETAGLGSDAFGGSAFGAYRRRMKRAIFAAHAGVQFNGSGRRFAETADRDGETAAQVGFGVIYPFSDNVSGVAEFDFRDGRLEGDKANSQLLGGVNWRVGGRGTIRGALSFGLADGAPDFAVVGGYAAVF
jgi:hypothetical protein